MKRLRLSAKLALAIIPIGIVALIAAGFIAFTFLGNSEDQNETAHAATVSADAIEALKAVWDEEGQAREVYIFGNEDKVDDLASAIEETDEAIAALRDSTEELQDAADGFFDEVAFTLTQDLRNVTDVLNQMRSISTPNSAEIEGYHDVAGAILAILPKTSSIISDRVQARDLFTAYYLAEGGQISLEQEQLIEEFRAQPDPEAPDADITRSGLQQTLEVLESEFGSWALRANQTANVQSAAILRYTRLPDVDIDTFPLRRNEDILNTSENLAQGVAEESQANAADSETEAYVVAGVAALILLLALVGSYAVIRSVVRRVRGVTDAAVRVSEEDLPALVGALQNPSDDVSALTPTMIEDAGKDEVGDLAESFTLLHSTLIEVAGQQMDILRKGVSEIFVTLARRNRSLVDRQLALLDELESTEEDPVTLGGYYKLDHLATRMRRNAESLLVLAGSEPTRIWSNPLDVSEIIRAALGEVDDYQRVDIMALEPALVSGRAVADIAHLMSELLDNGTQYSSPTDRVRVAGLFDPDGYMLTVSDSGIGMSQERIAEFNALLDNPPVLGLALQPTLGMYVVARLAARHGVRVQLIAGSPGLTVRVLLPKSLIEPAPPKEIAPEESPEVPRSAEATVAGATGALASQAQEEDEAEEFAPSSVFPGTIKGRHEHPGRSRILEHDFEGFDEDVAELEKSSSPEPSDVSPFAADTGSEERPGALKKRIPGEALSLEQSEGESRGHDESEDAPIVEEPVVASVDQDVYEGEVVSEFEIESDSIEEEVGDIEDDDAEELFAPVEWSESAEPVFEAEDTETDDDLGEVVETVRSGSRSWGHDAELDVPEVAKDDHEGAPEEADEEVGLAEPAHASSEEPEPVSGNGASGRDRTESPWWLDQPTAEDLEKASASSDVDSRADTEEEVPVVDPKEQDRPRITPTGLPVRTPGTSFRETDESASSSAASTSGAIGIRSALNEFTDARTLASQKVAERENEDDDTEGRSE